RWSRRSTAGPARFSARSSRRLWGCRRTHRRQVVVPECGGCRLRERRIRLGRLGGLALDAGLVRERRRIDGVDDFVRAGPAADGDQEGRAVAGADDDVIGVGRAMQVVPLLHRVLLAFDDRQAFAGEDEEPLLVGLAVVHGDGLAGPHDGVVETELVEALVALEVARDPERTLVVPVRVADVADVPGHAASANAARYASTAAASRRSAAAAV